MSILVYSGLRELIKRQFHDRDMATIDATANSIYSMIGEVMSDYRAKAIQIVGTLPVTGVAGTIYVMSKSEPNEKNRFIAYVFENGKYVQVGSSFFPEDFEHDAELSTTSHVTVENRAIHAELRNKYNVSSVIDNVVYNDEHSIHAKDTPTSAAIKRELDSRMGYEDGNRITDEMLWQLFRPEDTRLIYPEILLDCKSIGSYTRFYRLEGKDMLTGLRYKSGLSDMLNKDLNRHDYWTGIFTDLSSDRDIRIVFKINAPSAYSFYIGSGLYDGYNSPSEYEIYTNWSNSDIHMVFMFLDPIPIGLLKELMINFKAAPGFKLKISTYTSDTPTSITSDYWGQHLHGDFVPVQENIFYDDTYTDGIPFYGFNN